jgi:outer membrane murein-binding lipoprotein Lpp
LILINARTCESGLDKNISTRTLESDQTLDIRIKESRMFKIVRPVALLGVAASFFLLSGCTNQAEMTTLRSEVSSATEAARMAEEKAQSAEQRAAAAEARARAAEQQAADALQRAASAEEQARAANAKADRTFKQSLTK